MAMGRFLEQELALRGHEVLMTRDGTVADDELDWRAAMSNEWGADLYISIHCNSFRKIEAEGTETYHYPGSAAGERLARAVQFRIRGCAAHRRPRRENGQLPGASPDGLPGGARRMRLYLQPD